MSTVPVSKPEHPVAPQLGMREVLEVVVIRRPLTSLFVSVNARVAEFLATIGPKSPSIGPLIPMEWLENQLSPNWMKKR